MMESTKRIGDGNKKGKWNRMNRCRGWSFSWVELSQGSSYHEGRVVCVELSDGSR